MSYNIIFLAIVVAFGLTSNAAEWVSKEGGVSFQIPSDPGWEQMKGLRPEVKLLLRRTDKSVAVAFVVLEKKAGSRTMSENLIKGWEKGYYRKGGAEKVSGEFFIFKGRSAYKAIDRVTKDGVRTIGTVILWVEDDRLVEIVASKDDGDPLQDTVIKTFVDSMKSVQTSPK